MMSLLLLEDNEQVRQYHFTSTAATKTYVEIHLFFLLNVIHIILHVIPQHTSDLLTETACHVRDLM